MMSIIPCGMLDSNDTWVESPVKDLPWGDYCDPNEELPTPPPSNETEVDLTILESLECPLDEPVSFQTSCESYPVGESCNYGHLYLGCSWDDLRCSRTTGCRCNTDGTWRCSISSVTPCGMFDSSNMWVDTTPKDLPWGVDCDPNEELPTPPPTEDPVNSRLSDECPLTARGAESCSGFTPNLECDYNHAYSGCRWDNLGCRPIRQCECNKFSDGNWACREESGIECVDKPMGHPGNVYCDPQAPLPTEEDAATTARAGEASVIAQMMDGAMP